MIFSIYDFTIYSVPDFVYLQVWTDAILSIFWFATLFLRYETADE